MEAIVATRKRSGFPAGKFVNVAPVSSCLDHSPKQKAYEMIYLKDVAFYGC